MHEKSKPVFNPACKELIGFYDLKIETRIFLFYSLTDLFYCISN